MSDQRKCRHCRWWFECNRHEKGRKNLAPQCQEYEREPGSDDDRGSK